MAVSPRLLSILGINPLNPNDEVLIGDDGPLNVFIGGDGNDYIEGKGGLVDTLAGGLGSDTLGYSESSGGVSVSLPGFLFDPVSGSDAIGDVVTADFENVVGSEHNDTLVGDIFTNILVGLGGADNLLGGGGDDLLIGGGGGDFLFGDTGTDSVSYELAISGVSVSLSTGLGTAGEAAGDILIDVENLVGSDFADDLEGNFLSNVIVAGSGDDAIRAAGANDVIIAGAGNDRLSGDAGADSLTGGIGADVFAYSNVSDSSGDGVDFIADFRHSEGDRIDLSLIDANPFQGGDQAFTFIGNDGFHNVAGELRVLTNDVATFVLGDTTGDGNADFIIALDNVIVFTPQDFLL